jgi:hypothetical protein
MNPDENYPRRAATVARAGADRNCQPDRVRGEHRGEFVTDAAFTIDGGYLG